MRIISFIEDSDVIRKILKHQDLPTCVLHADRWEVKSRPPPKANAPPEVVLVDYFDSQIPSADDYLIDSDYPITDGFTKSPTYHLTVIPAKAGIHSL